MNKTIPISTDTTDRTIGSDSSRLRLCYRPGEQLLVRSALEQSFRHSGRQSLFAFHFISDSHHTDTGTGRAMEMIRQLDPGDGELGRVYRSWAPFTGATLIACLKTINAIKVSPLSGNPVALVVLGGDFIDNSQINELRSFASILSGQVAKPFRRTFTLSGTPFTFEPDKAGRCTDSRSNTLKLSSSRPSSSPLYRAAALPMAGGEPLAHPALFVLGNHDLEALGHFSHSWLTSLWAVQPLKLMACSPIDIPNIRDLSLRLEHKDSAIRTLAWREVVRHLCRMRSNLCIAWSKIDINRRAVTIKKAWQTFAPLFKDLPIEQAGPAYYACRPRPGLVFCMLDTNSHDGGAEGHVTHQQFQWLEAELSRAETNGELAIVVSHHPSCALIEERADPLSDGPVHLADDLKQLLLAKRSVIAHLAGHTHRNHIVLHQHPTSPANSYWEITTCSTIDWPQQFRFMELFRNGNGTLSLCTMMINHMAPPDPGYIELPAGLKSLPEDIVIKLASFGRKLAYRDYLLGHDGPAGRHASGRHQDRNVELVLQDPYA